MHQKRKKGYERDAFLKLEFLFAVGIGSSYVSDFYLGSVKDYKEAQKLGNEVDDTYPQT